jgi:hypothetical protein
MKRIQRLDEDTFCLALDLNQADSADPCRDRSPVIVLNGFYAKLHEDFEALGCVALWIERAPNSPTSWELLRTEYAGKTNPVEAAPGSIRGDAARGILPVETVSVLANVIHLSANEAEGHREVQEVWWAPSWLAFDHADGD